jgi:hypothetical protein
MNVVSIKEKMVSLVLLCFLSLHKQAFVYCKSLFNLLLVMVFMNKFVFATTLLATF